MRVRKASLIVLVPALVGGEARGCPGGMVPVPRSNSCIDRFEWPNRAGTKPMLGATAVPSPYDRRRGVTMDAESLCRSVGKRTCRLEEWVSSCRGKGGTDYPFGREIPERKPAPEDAPCNYAQWFRKPDERKVWRRDPAEMERLDQSDPSGARGCVSGSGAEDMTGNAEEWIRCPKWMSSSCSGGACYCLAGRYWSDAVPCQKVTAGHAPTWHYYETGFRCCWP